MLHIVLGTDWVSNRNEILRRISGDVAGHRGNRILLVPELISHDMERRLCASAGDTASRFAEVLSFTRFARRVAEYTQDPGPECLDNGGRIVAMAAAVRSLHSKLKAYAAVETRPEFLGGLVDAVDEFKRCRITSAELLDASRQTSGSLAQKLEELSIILDAYDGLCRNGKRDPRDRETQLLEQLEDSNFGENHVFYIDGFPDFTRQHLAILEHLIRVSPEVTVSINCDRVSSGAMAFEKTGQTAAELLKCARKAGVAVDIQQIKAEETNLNGVREVLFQGSVQPDPAWDGQIQTFLAEDMFQECTEAAQRVHKLVQDGCRYRDISVVCGNLPAYQDTLEMVFRRCGIPLYRSGTESILQQNVISSLLYALDAVLNGFEQRDVLHYLRSLLPELNPDLCDRVENYAIMWGIRGSKWLFPWENNPDGLGEIWSDGAKRRLAVLEDARKQVMEPLRHMKQDFENSKNMAQQVEAVYVFLERVHLADRLAKMAKDLDKANNNRGAQILNQLWEILLTALEQLHDMLGSTKWDDETFTRLLTLLLGQYDVGTIPPVLDAVMCGGVSAMRCQEQQHLFVLGAEEGSLPGYGGSKGVLTDQERVALRKLGVTLTGGAMEGIQAEFSEIYGVFCGTRKTVTVSSASGQPSFLFRRLEALAGGSRNLNGLYGTALADRFDAGAFLSRYGAEREAASLNAVEGYRWTQERIHHTLGQVSPEGIQGLYGSALNLSASQVDRKGECRLSYFLKYGLRARERKEASIDPAEFGTFVHAVLEDTAKAVMERGGFHQVSLEETLDLAREFSKAYADERFQVLDSERTEYLFRRNGQELEMVVRELWSELSMGSFEPKDFETAFGGDGNLSAIPIHGKRMEAYLRGFVDRVDVWQEHGQNYFRVVDYKTGRKDFDYCDVYNGIGLQMLLYLFALEKEGQSILGDHPVSAGVQYFPARVPHVSADGRLTDEEAEQLRQKEWKRKGLLLNDEQVLRAMEPEDAPKRLCATWKKDGTISGDLADREQFDLLRTYVFLILGKMVDDIAAGNVEPDPYTRGSSHNACAFCPYSPVCGSDDVEGRRNYKTMSAQRFWEEIQKEVDRHG